MPTILVVDDDPMAGELIEQMCKPLGIEVVSTFTGTAGIELARQIKPNLILMDLLLPGTLDGWQATEIIKADRELARIPVIAITAVGDSESAHQIGFDGYIRKPLTPGKLKDYLRKYL